MVDEHSKHMWSHTSTILALLANANRDPKKHSEPFMPDDFNPHVKRKGDRTVKITGAQMKKLWVANGGRS